MKERGVIAGRAPHSPVACAMRTKGNGWGYIEPHDIGTVSHKNPPALRAAPFGKEGSGGFFTSSDVTQSLRRFRYGRGGKRQFPAVVVNHHPRALADLSG